MNFDNIKIKYDYEKEMFEKIKKFEIDANNPSPKGFNTGFNQLNKALENLQPGFHIIAGDSNHGKTAFLSQLGWQIANLNPNAYVMDFSLDDPMRSKMAMVVGSANKVLINAVKNPLRYMDMPDMLKRRSQGMNLLVNSIDKYNIYDANFSCFIEDIEKEIEQKQAMFKSIGINKKICVLIDNFHDLDTQAQEAKGSDKSKYDYLSQKVADMAIRLDIPIICTAEFRKLNNFKRPAIDDIRESVKIKYEAKSILLIYNEVSAKGEAAQIFFNVNNNALKQPIFEVKVGKNKYSSFKGRMFFYFFPDMAYMKEVEEQQAKVFNNLLYSNS